MDLNTDRMKELKDPVITIERLWFDDDRIFIRASDGKDYSLPLEVFPTLFYASPTQRNAFRINHYGDAARWEEIDEDIHISSFFEDTRVDYDNEVNRLLSDCPCLDMKEFAQYLGMHWTKLARFRFGVRMPSEKTMMRIREGISAIGKEMVHLAAV